MENIDQLKAELERAKKELAKYKKQKDDFKEYSKTYYANRRATDAEFNAKQRAYQSAYAKKRYSTDLVYREKVKQKNKELYRKKNGLL